MPDGVASIRWFDRELHAVLQSRGGMVDRFSFKEAQKVVNKAKVLTGGQYHGVWQGVQGAPSAPGSPPGVRTGAGRRSIRARPEPAFTNSWMVGSDMFYMSILELRSHAPYPWLVPALASLGYPVRKGMTSTFLA